MRRVSILLSLVMALALLLAACGAPPTQPPPAGEAAAPAEAAPAGTAPPAAEAPAQPEPTATAIVAEAGTGDTKLVYWNGLTGSDGVTMAEIVKSFTDENPDVSVRIEMMPWNIYFDKLLTSLVSGNPPDLFLLHEFEIPQFARQGVLLETSEFFTSGGGALPDDDYPDFVMDAVHYEGKTYGVPFDIHGWGIWANADMLAAAGIDPQQPPANQEELIDYAQRLTLDANGKHAGEEGFDPENVTQWGLGIAHLGRTFMSFLWQQGQDEWTAEQEAQFTSPEAKNALQFMYDLIYTYHVTPPPAAVNVPSAYSASTMAMMFNGSWNLNRSNDAGFNWVTWPFPTVFDQPAVWISSHVIYAPTSLEGEKLDAAKRLIDYLSQNGLVWATAGQPPARISEQEQLTAEEFPSTTMFKDSFMAEGRYYTAHPAIQEIQQGYEPELDAALNDIKSVDQALEDANKRVQGVLDRFKE